MRLTVWSINYRPELVGIGAYNTQMCEYLAKRGHEISMLTAFPYYPEWKKRKYDRGKFFEKDELDGVSVYRCWLYVPKRVTVAARIIHEASFVLTSFFAALFMRAPDVYVVVSPPLLLGIAAYVISRIKRRPFVFHIQDMQPGAAVRVGLLKPGKFVQLLCAIETFIYQHADLVTGITDQMLEEIVQNGADKRKVAVFPNWVELPTAEEKPTAGNWKRLRGFTAETKIVTYCGSIGRKQGVEIILQAAEALKNEDFQFVICGSGSHRSEIEQHCKQKALRNVFMGDLLPEQEHSELLTDSDVCLLPQLAGTGASFFPSKLLKILAYKCPVVTNADPQSSLYSAIEDAQCGFIVEPHDAEGFANAIKTLLLDSSLRLKMGESGFRWVSQFETSTVLHNFEKRLESLCTPAQTRHELSRK